STSTLPTPGMGTGSSETSAVLTDDRVRSASGARHSSSPAHLAWARVSEMPSERIPGTVPPMLPVVAGVGLSAGADWADWARRLTGSPARSTLRLVAVAVVRG